MGIEYISEESIRNYTKAKKLCESLGETQHLFALLYGDWARYILPSKHKAGAEIADRLLALGTEHGETVPILLANRLLGWSKFLAGDLLSTGKNTEKTLNLYDPAKHRSLCEQYVFDPKVGALCCQALQLWMCGFPDRASESQNEAIDYARELNQSNTLGYALQQGALELRKMF